ncbi:MAG: C40 family peptidase [Burkholderiales bacterium]|nr:C40 family peptidase [Burkholderiales bacterium]
MGLAKPEPALLRICAVLGMALLILLTGCSSTPPLPRSAEPAALSTVPARLSREQANDVTIHAVGLVGTPYRHGGNTPDGGFDCSGLIRYVYKTGAGVTAPRTVSLLADWGQPIPADALQTGDLVVFTLGGVTSHAGIYVGEGRFVHAPSTGGEVRMDRLASTYWSRQQLAFRRP